MSSESSAASDKTYQAWSGALNSVILAFEVVEIINNCENIGKWGENQCQKQDYTKHPILDTPSITIENPWTRTFRDLQTEQVAKTAWCIEKGYQNYSIAKDRCMD